MIAPAGFAAPIKKGGARVAALARLIHGWGDIGLAGVA
jgi:hypothetical protein